MWSLGILEDLLGGMAMRQPEQAHLSCQERLLLMRFQAGKAALLRRSRRQLVLRRCRRRVLLRKSHCVLLRRRA